jgi:Spy/CpxP family protein refolding chaperone
MKKTIALITSLTFCLLVSPLALRAQDSSPAPSGDNGGCQGGSGDGGWKHHKHHDHDKGDKPTPSPSPAQ